MQFTPRYAGCLVLAILLVLMIASEGFSQPSTFTYQGRLTDNMAVAGGTYQMQFALFDAVANGTQIGSTIENGGVSVNNGVFTVQLDFGPNAFPGAERFLELSVRRNSGEGYVTLTPRQRITSAPYAVRSANAASSDSLSSNCVGCISTENIRGGVVNPKKVALFRWYETNLGSVPPPNYTCAGGRSLGFDGARMWVGGNCGHYAINVDSFTAVSVGAGGGLAYGYAYDGAYMWYVNGTNVTKQHPDSGFPPATYAAGSVPRGIAYDGTNMWVANTFSNNVTKMRTDGVTLATIAVGTGPQWIAFDGTFVWVSNTFATTISRINTNDNSVTSFPVAASPRGIVFDGSNVWVALQNCTIAKIRTTDGSVTGTFTVGCDAQGVSFDGANIWVAASSSSTITKLRASDGALVGNYFSPGGPQNLAFDGVNMWVIHNTSGVIRKM